MAFRDKSESPSSVAAGFKDCDMPNCQDNTERDDESMRGSKVPKDKDGAATAETFTQYKLWSDRAQCVKSCKTPAGSTGQHSASSLRNRDEGSATTVVSLTTAKSLTGADGLESKSGREEPNRSVVAVASQKTKSRKIVGSPVHDKGKPKKSVQPGSFVKLVDDVLDQFSVAKAKLSWDEWPPHPMQSSVSGGTNPSRAFQSRDGCKRCSVDKGIDNASAFSDQIHYRDLILRSHPLSGRYATSQCSSYNTSDDLDVVNRNVGTGRNFDNGNIIVGDVDQTTNTS
jgi:hypothetical protein